MNLEREGNKIISKENINEGIKYILENDSFLSDSFNCLPNGRIDKQVTGIGATHLELISKRNSIIVEPLKSIASIKANKHNAIYVGSPTKRHPEKITNGTVKKEIQSKAGHKKIIVVADSLKRLMKLLPETAYSDYFIAVDEIDTFQSDGNYREKLEQVMDEYFKFENRCVVSATLKEFSNPKLANEPLTIFSYEKPQKKKLNLQVTTIKNLHHKVADKIKELDRTGEKIVVAYNYITGILEIIELLPDELKTKCKILCSENSKYKVQEYYGTLEENLPNQITFLTCAYFSGVDILDQFHGVCVANAKSNFMVLSGDKIKQILGRGRNGTVSNHIISTTKLPQNTKKELSKEILLDYAKRIILSLQCVSRVYRDDYESKELMNKIREAVEKSGNIENYRLTRKSDNTYVPAYFNIDALLEENKTINSLYLKKESLEKFIKENHHLGEVEYDFPKSDTVDTSAHDAVKKNLKSQRNEQLTEILELLSTKNLKSLNKEAKGIQSKIIYQYKKLLDYYDKPIILKKLKELNQDQRDSRKFNAFYQTTVFLATDNSHVFKREVLDSFPIGSYHTKEQVLEKLNYIYDKADIGLPKLKSTTRAVRELKLYFDAKKSIRIVNAKFGIKEIVYRVDGVKVSEYKLKKPVNDIWESYFKGRIH